MFVQKFLFVKTHFGSDRAVKIVPSLIPGEALLEFVLFIEGSRGRDRLDLVAKL